MGQLNPSLNWIPARWHLVRRDLWLPIAGLTPLVAIFASRGASVLAAISLAAFIAGRWRVVRGAVARVPRVPAILIALFVAWGGASAAWSLSPGTSISKAATVLGIGLATLVMAGEASRTPIEARRLAVIVATGSCWIAAITLLVSGLAGRTSLRWLHPSGHWDENWINRPATTLVVFMTIGSASQAASGRWLGAAALALLSTMAAVASTSQSAALAGFLAIVFFTAWTLAGRWSTPTFMGLVCLVAAVTPFVGLTLPTLGLEALNLPRSFVHRIEIWQFASGLALERSLIGIGLDAYRNIAELTPVRSLWSLHPHNLVLQIWIETGVVGVVLATAAIISLLAAVGRMDTVHRPYAQAGIVAALAIASLAWGAWQGWWLSTIALAIVLFAAMPAAVEPPAKESPRQTAGARVVTGRIDDRSVE